jgi:hypothetical protein
MPSETLQPEKQKRLPFDSRRKSRSSKSSFRMIDLFAEQHSKVMENYSL